MLKTCLKTLQKLLVDKDLDLDPVQRQQQHPEPVQFPVVCAALRWKWSNSISNFHQHNINEEGAVDCSLRH
jgi:hypothetical protein